MSFIRRKFSYSTFFFFLIVFLFPGFPFLGSAILTDFCGSSSGATLFFFDFLCFRFDFGFRLFPSPPDSLNFFCWILFQDTGNLLSFLFPGSSSIQCSLFCSNIFHSLVPQCLLPIISPSCFRTFRSKYQISSK